MAVFRGIIHGPEVDVGCVNDPSPWEGVWAQSLQEGWLEATEGRFREPPCTASWIFHRWTSVPYVVTAQLRGITLNMLTK